jgi:hypothetical protein
VLKKVITLVAVLAVLGLMSVAAASASERARVRDDVAKTSAGLQTMEATQLQQQLQAQDPTGDPVMAQNRTRTQAQLMVHDPDCTDCEGGDQLRARIHQDSAGHFGPNRDQAGNAGPNGDGPCDGTGPNGDGTCDGTGPHGSTGYGGAGAGRS